MGPLSIDLGYNLKLSSFFGMIVLDVLSFHAKNKKNAIVGRIETLSLITTQCYILCKKLYTLLEDDKY